MAWFTMQDLFGSSEMTSSVQQSSLAYHSIWLALGFTMLLFTSQKVPFDLVEAESELIDGITTDLPGVAFSVVYSMEIAFGLIGLLIFVLPLRHVSNAAFALIGMVLLFFVGRMFLARMLLVDACELGLSLFLSLATLVVMIF